MKKSNSKILSKGIWEDIFPETYAQLVKMSNGITLEDTINQIKQDILNEAHFRGYFLTNAELIISPGNLNDYAYSAESGTKWIYSSNGWTNSGEAVPDKITPLSDATPSMNGVASAGNSNEASRADHIHPIDTSRASATELATVKSDLADTTSKLAVPNPSGTGTDYLDSLLIEGKIYEIPSLEIAVSDVDDPAAIPIKTLKIGKDNYSFDINNATVVRADVVQNLTNAQKQQAQRNVLLRSSATLKNAGWYKIANSPNGVHLRINLANAYSGAQPSVVQVDVYKGHTDNNSKLEIKAEGCAIGYFTKLRIFNNNDIEVYCSASTSTTTATCMIELTARDSNDVTIYNFEPSTNTGSALKEIDIKNGINTTGKIYENGGRVLSVNSSDLSDNEEDAIKNNIGINTSVTETQRVYANYALSASSTSWKKIASFYIGDFNIGIKISGGLDSSQIYRELRICGSNGNVAKLDSWEFGVINSDIYYVYRDKAGNFAYLDVYAKFAAYYKYYISVEATGCNLVEKGNTSELTNLPVNAVKLSANSIMSIDSTTLTPSTDNGWSIGDSTTTLSDGQYKMSIITDGEAGGVFDITVSDGNGGYSLSSPYGKDILGVLSVVISNNKVTNISVTLVVSGSVTVASQSIAYYFKKIA